MKQIRRHRSSSKCMRFHFDDIISFATTFMTLNPGDTVIEAEVKKMGTLKTQLLEKMLTSVTPGTSGLHPLDRSPEVPILIAATFDLGHPEKPFASDGILVRLTELINAHER